MSVLLPPICWKRRDQIFHGQVRRLSAFQNGHSYHWCLLQYLMEIDSSGLMRRNRLLKKSRDFAGN
jgi:hypothetical protein